MKNVTVSLTEEAEEIYNYLKSTAPDSKTEEMILNAFLQKIELIKKDIHHGQPIAKNLFPKEYKKQYGITNLFRVELPGFWRMLYTLTQGNSGVEIVVVVLDIADHDLYDKLFGYNK